MFTNKSTIERVGSKMYVYFMDLERIETCKDGMALLTKFNSFFACFCFFYLNKRNIIMLKRGKMPEKKKTIHMQKKKKKNDADNLGNDIKRNKNKHHNQYLIIIWYIRNISYDIFDHFSFSICYLIRQRFHCR